MEVSQQEREDIGLAENPETRRIEWDVEKEVPLQVEFSGDEMAYLKEACEKISDESLPDDMWGTVEKIFDGVCVN